MFASSRRLIAHRGGFLVVPILLGEFHEKGWTLLILGLIHVFVVCCGKLTHGDNA